MSHSCSWGLAVLFLAPHVVTTDHHSFHSNPVTEDLGLHDPVTTQEDGQYWKEKDCKTCGYYKLMQMPKLLK